MVHLPEGFLNRPIAHRGLHSPGVPENSLAAAEAAIAAGYAIELDIQGAAGGAAMVFHDYDLTRLVGDEGYVADMTPEDLAVFRLRDSDEAIPTLPVYLRKIAGRAPLLIEIKDQDGRLGRNIGDLHHRVVKALEGYAGPVAVMSFNPYVITALHKIAPTIAVGLITCDFNAKDWPMLDDEARHRMADIDAFATSGASFISHERTDLRNPRVDALRAQGVRVLCWTVRSPAEETAARAYADNITFENYAAPV